MEIKIERDERSSAPLHLVWDELDSLDQLPAKTPPISLYELVPTGERARAKADHAWGPLRWAEERLLT